MAGEAVPPPRDRVGVAVEFLGDAEVGGLVGLGAAQDEARAESKALGSEARMGNLGEAVEFVGGKGEASRFAGHERASVLGEKRNEGESR